MRAASRHHAETQFSYDLLADRLQHAIEQLEAGNPTGETF